MFLKWVFDKIGKRNKRMTYMGFRNKKYVLSNTGGFIPIYKLTQNIAIDKARDFIDISNPNECQYIKDLYPNEIGLEYKLNYIYEHELLNITDRYFNVMYNKVGDIVAIYKSGAVTNPMKANLGVSFFNNYKDEIKTIYRV